MNMGKTYAVTRYRGFTLVELLVVLLILGLLAGLVGPRVLKYLGGAKNSAQGWTCFTWKWGAIRPRTRGWRRSRKSRLVRIAGTGRT